jgi:hypothetical protein
MPELNGHLRFSYRKDEDDGAFDQLLHIAEYLWLLFNGSG